MELLTTLTLLSTIYISKIFFTELYNTFQRPTFKKIKLSNTTLLFGYDLETFKPITSNMLINPHVAVIGTSNQGKSKCIETALMNLENCEITLINTMPNDYKNVKALRINDLEDIKDYFYKVTHTTKKLTKPLYIVIDEFTTLTRLTRIDNIMTQLLAQARHYNIYIITILQTGGVAECNFINLFNTRIAFKLITDHQYYNFLSTTVQDKLNQQEFYILTDELKKCKTYKMLD